LHGPRRRLDLQWADDDGSGTVAVIELAQAFASARERPKRSLLFMTVSGEERGLWGARTSPTIPRSRSPTWSRT